MDMDATLAVAAVERTKPFEISGDAVLSRLARVDALETPSTYADRPCSSSDRSVSSCL